MAVGVNSIPLPGTEAGMACGVLGVREGTGGERAADLWASWAFVRISGVHFE